MPTLRPRRRPADPPPLPQRPRRPRVPQQTDQEAQAPVEKSLLLSRIYYGESAGALRGPKALFDEARRQGLTHVSFQDAKDFLASQSTYTLYRRARRNYPRNKINAHYIGDVVQIDIMDMQRYKDSNKHLYVILAYDTYSKYLQGVPLKDRKPPGIIKALETFIEGPIGISNIYWDKEGSFLSRAVQSFLKKVEIGNYTTTSKVKAPGVERVIRTIRTAVQRFFHHNKTAKWEQFLPKFIRSYNNRKHSTTHQKPDDVIKNPLLVVEKPEPPQKKIELPPVGSYVRINRLRKIFDKESSGTWTSEVFRVVSHKKSSPIPMIRLADLLGEPVLGAFYPHEYQPIVFDDQRKVDVVHKTRRTRGKPTQYLVSFVGYPASYTEWIDRKS